MDVDGVAINFVVGAISSVVEDARVMKVVEIVALATMLGAENEAEHPSVENLEAPEHIIVLPALIWR